MDESLTNRIVIDGSEGEGGGQMLRSSLTLSAIYGKPFEMVNIRASRPKPGLKRQHLTCVRAMAEICGAEVEGDTVDSMRLKFTPDEIRAGEYRFDVGSAGSITLVAQTVLPVLLLADAPSVVTITGGTHVPYAPTWDFFERTYLRELEEMGADVDATIEEYGFYPAGGGRVKLRIQPLERVYPYVKQERGKYLGGKVSAMVSGLDASIAAKEVRLVMSGLPEWGLAEEVRKVASAGPGNCCHVRLEFEECTLVFSEIGTRGMSSEEVAAAVVRKVRSYLGSGKFMERYLADQVLVPLVAFLGERGAPDSTEWDFGAPEIETQHYKTNCEVIRKFMRG